MTTHEDARWEVWRPRRGRRARQLLQPGPPLPFGLQVPAGRLSFSGDAFNRLGQPEAVVLLYDNKARLVGLRKAETDDLDSYRVGTAGKNRSYHVVVVKDFIRRNRIEFDRAMRFPGHDYDGVYGFSLAEGVPVVRGDRSRQRTPESDALHAAPPPR